jgi:hypothetical protein
MHMATMATVRWRTPPPSSVDERLIIGDDGRAQLVVLRPRTVGDTVGIYEGAVSEDEVRELTAAGSDVEVDVTAQDAGLGGAAVAADRIAQRLLGSPLAVAQFFARPIGAVPPIPQTLALCVLGGGSQPVEFELDLAQCAIHFSSSGTPVSWIPSPDLPMGFLTSDAEALGGVRQRALVEPGVLGTISLPLEIPEGVNELSAQVVGSWFLPGDESGEDFEARTAAQPI